jgi:hypothetical protein
MSYCFEHKTYKCEFESGSENKKSELLALAPTLTLFVAPSGLPASLRSRDRLLALPSQKNPACGGIFVAPSGLEPELF